MHCISSNTNLADAVTLWPCVVPFFLHMSRFFLCVLEDIPVAGYTRTTNVGF